MLSVGVADRGPVAVTKGITMNRMGPSLVTRVRLGLIRLYGPLEPSIDEMWRRSEIEPMG
jgi:hypothetical protein